jgi:trehalose utilization protein
MPIRATVWGENVHEQKNKDVAALYPNGMHGQIAALLSEDKNIKASTVTLQDPEHGMTEAKLDDVLLSIGDRDIDSIEDLKEQLAAAQRTTFSFLLSVWFSFHFYQHNLVNIFFSGLQGRRTSSSGSIRRS